MVNSPTKEDFLDDVKYWAALEPAEAREGCLYIHPRGPAAGLAGPLRD